MDEDDAHDAYLPLICPVTGAPCTTEQDEFCEDYGCARKAGIDVDRDLIAIPAGMLLMIFIAVVGR